MPKLRGQFSYNNVKCTGCNTPYMSLSNRSISMCHKCQQKTSNFVDLTMSIDKNYKILDLCKKNNLDFKIVTSNTGPQIVIRIKNNELIKRIYSLLLTNGNS